jgi:hypothetical protein
MVLYPEVQKHAQAEIDAIVGQDRYPAFEDRDKLPYIGALIQELLRWAPVAPQGQPRDFIVLIPAHSQRRRAPAPRNEGRCLRGVPHTHGCNRRCEHFFHFTG